MFYLEMDLTSFLNEVSYRAAVVRRTSRWALASSEHSASVLHPAAVVARTTKFTCRKPNAVYIRLIIIPHCIFSLFVFLNEYSV